MVTIKNTKFFYALEFLSISFFGGLILVMLCPTITSGANAEVTPFADSAAFGLDINAESVVSIGINNPEGIDITPKAGGSTNTQNATVTVTTNNKDGYKMYLQTTDSNNQLSNVSVSTTDKINSISSTTGVALDSTGFEQNAWGYSFSQGTVTDEAAKNLLYRGIPAASTPIVPNGVTSADGTLTSATGVDTYTLSFGAKVNPSIAAGKYSTQVIVSAVANPVAVTDLNTLTYMQDMTPDICKNTKGTDGNATVTAGKEPTRRLIDTRDGNVYWVSKLADQNCWMVQNLALNITSDMITMGSLNSSNTDLGYTGAGQLAPENGTIWSNKPTANSSTDGMASCPADTLISEGGNCTVINGKSRYIPNASITLDKSQPIKAPEQIITDTQSTNIAKYVISRPLWNFRYNSLRYSFIDEYKPYGAINVSDSSKWKPTYDSMADPVNANATGKDFRAIKCTAGEEKFNDAGTELISFCTAGEYDPHYLMGNAYQWNTATAGSGGSIINQNATNSICPKGWRLSPGGRNDDNNNWVKPLDSAEALLIAYGWELNGFDLGDTPQNNPYVSLISPTGYNFAKAPFYFSTGINLYEEDFLDSYGLYFSIWDSTATQNMLPGGAYRFGSGTKNHLYPSAWTERYLQTSVRCIAR